MVTEKKSSEGQRQKRIAERFSASLMNNTKWREVWEILVELRLRIHFAYAVGDDWNEANSGKLFGPFPATYVQERGIADPGIGGPFRYVEIRWIRVPKVRGNDTEAFCQRLESLGQLPIRITPEFVEVRGYHDDVVPWRTSF